MAVSTKARTKVDGGKKITPEIYFARKLASNDKKIRDRTLKKLKRWLTARSAVPEAFNEDELLKLWKGLFYCMWMSDKPLIQEDLAETISSLVYSVVDRKLGIKFVSIALKTMARDWSGIDTWRMDKFMMFVRRIFRHSLEYLAQGDWNEDEVALYTNMMTECVLGSNQNKTSTRVPIGLQLHIINLFTEELAKAGGEDISAPILLKILEPFAKCLATSEDPRVRKEIFQYVFTYLIRQSDEGLAYEDEEAEKRRASGSSKRGGPKAKTIQEEDDEVEEDAKANEDDEDVEDLENGDGDSNGEGELDDDQFDWDVKDPRAGGVDVVIPQLQPDYTKLADMLFEIASQKTVRGKNRKAMYGLVKWFRDLADGIYPLVANLPVVSEGLTPKMMKKARQDFVKDELRMTAQRMLENDKKNAERKETKKSLKKPQKAGKKLIEEADLEEIEEEEGEAGDNDLEEEEMEEAADEDHEDDSEVEEDDDIEDEESSDEDQPQVVIKKASSKSKPVVATFEVEDNWEDDSPTDNKVAYPAAIKQLKQKLKNRKRPNNSGWTESPVKGETEIVIPSKKFKEASKFNVSKSPVSHQKPDETLTPNVRNKRVNFVLNKNSAQEPRDYQESIRKSPGVPHDPDRQPSGGGLLKRTTDRSKSALAGSSKNPRSGPSARSFPKF